MKAIVLAAGYATRLYPLTKNQPKPLLEVAGKPILDHLLERLHELPIDHVYVVTNNKFYDHFESWKEDSDHALALTIVNDQTLSNDDRLGSLGDIQYVLDNHPIDDDVLVVAGDNLFAFSLKPMQKMFEEHGKTVVALYDVKDFELAKHYGIVEIDEAGLMTDFEEKPEKPKSTLSSTGIYLYPRNTIAQLKDFLHSEGKHDKAGDFLCWLHTREDVYGFVSDHDWYDIGSLDQLEKAREQFGT